MILRRLRDIICYLKGSFRCAKENGLHCGKNVSVMGGANFGSEPYLITLEDNVRISYNVSFITHDGGTWAFRHEDAYRDISRFGKIIVGEYSFIGANAIIMPNVRIGKHCVIGAGSVVTKSIPDYSVVVGVPAKVISDTHTYAEKLKNLMPENWDMEAYCADKREYLEKKIPMPW